MSRDELVQDVNFLEMACSVFQLYGFKKMYLKSKAQYKQVGDLCRFELDGRTAYWPVKADAERLIDMYFEVFSRNAHKFDRTPTLISPEDVVLDIGCCEGFFALGAIEKGASKVYCFEPGNTVRKALEKTFEHELDTNRVEIVGKVLGETPGELTFRDNPADPSISAVISDSTLPDDFCYKLPMTTLDAFAIEKELTRVDFLKVDVEGYEMEVLRGANDFIRKYQPKIAIATYHKPGHAHEIRNLLSEININYRFRLNGMVDFDGIVRPVMLHCHIGESR